MDNETMLNDFTPDDFSPRKTPITEIIIYSERTGEKEYTLLYGLDLEQSIIAAIEQVFKNNFNTWEYPKHIDGLCTGSVMIPGNRLYKILEGSQPYGGHIIQALEK